MIELHGNGTYARCLECGLRYELAGIRAAFDQDGQPPRCSCGGVIKSATISFGQAMPENEMRRARAATLNCDLMLAIGSSLVVYPAAGFPQLAQRHGARLVIINNAPTPLDDDADVRVAGRYRRHSRIIHLKKFASSTADSSLHFEPR